MKDYDFFPGEGKFYKANLHCHTVISDGKLTKEQIKEEYQKRGYSIVAFTDHRTYGYHPELTDENFIALAGLEVDVSENPEKCGGWPHAKCYHLNFYDEHPEEGKEFPLPTYVYEDMAGQNAYIKERTEAGFLCCYNHPYWSLQNYDDYKDFEGLWAMEIYNHGCEHDGLYGFNPQSYDEMLRSGQKLFTVATDDNHNIFPVTDPMCDSFGGFIQIKASELTYEAVIKAMKEGNFYFSMAPEIHKAKIEDGVLKVKTSPVEKIFVVTDSRDCYKKLAPKGETITEAEFPLNGKDAWVRIQIRDGKGKFAGTNAVYLK